MALIRQTLQPLLNQIVYPNAPRIIYGIPAIRQLYATTTLGLDNYLQQRERIKSQLANITAMFREKMTEYTSSESKNMVFTEDLKNMLHLAESDEDVSLAIKMMKKFNLQNKQLRFGNYIFGPVIMRLFHILNKHEEAFECFKAPELDGLFDQVMTYQILLDLLYENQRYSDMLQAFEIIKNKQIEGIKFARNVVVLVCAACYKLNTKESLDFALNLWSELNAIGHLPMRRAVTFCGALAINQGKPEIALEILSNQKNINYTTVRNLKVTALIDVGRIEDAFIILKSIIHEDTATLGPPQTFNVDVMEKVKDAVLQQNNQDITLEFNRIEKYFIQQGHISKNLLSEQLCQEIATPPIIRQKGNNNFMRQPQYFQSQDKTEFNSNYRRRVIQRPIRPGLTELQ